MDGLVLDTESSYRQAWQIAATQLGYPLADEFFLSLSGFHWPAVQQCLLSECGDDFPLQRFEQLSSECWHQFVQQHGIAVKAGFFALLDFIQHQNLPFCLATNSPQADALYCLQQAGLQNTFPHIVSRDQVRQGKPAPDIFFKAATGLGVAIEHCLILEDSLTGVIAAKQAQACVVLVPSVLPVDTRAQALADWVFADLQQVADFLDHACPSKMCQS